MYALLAGRPPFRARNLPQMLQLQRFASPEPVRRYAPDTPEQLERVIMQLLAKNPADRFPNTQVLARHLQAMVMALSRPAADDFALADEHPPDVPREVIDDHLLAVEATQSESQALAPQVAASADGVLQAKPGAGQAPSGPASHDAATLAADEVVLTNQPARKSAPPPRVPIKEATSSPAPERPAHFTTIAEEDARRRLEQQRSWIMVAAQLALLVAVLAGMGALALYLSKPPSADDLYQTITSQVDSEDEASLAEVSREIDEFLRRYPHDPRAAELAQYQEQIALNRLERRLQREARGASGAGATLIPVELLYLEAKKTADDSPARAAAMLQSLIDLYQPPASRRNDSKPAPGSATDADPHHDHAARTAAVVQLARRQLDQLQSEMAKQRAAQLAELDERMNVAQRLAASDARHAAAMYRAIVDLYQNEAWARDIVAEARRRLDRITKD
jgi:serine/threonine-protein kinase